MDSLESRYTRARLAGRGHQQYENHRYDAVSQRARMASRQLINKEQRRVLFKHNGGTILDTREWNHTYFKTGRN